MPDAVDTGQDFIETDPSDEELLKQSKEQKLDALDADDDEIADEAREEAEQPKRKSWLKDAAALKAQADAALAESKKLAQDLDQAKARLARIEESRKETKTETAPKRERMSGAQLIDLIDSKGEEGLEEILSGLLQPKLEAALAAQKEEFQAQLKAQARAGSLVQKHGFMVNADSAEFKAAAALVSEATKDEPDNASSIAAWDLAAQVVKLKAELEDVKRRRKSNTASGYVGTIDDDDTFDGPLPAGLEEFIAGANKYHGRPILTRAKVQRDIQRAAGRTN